MSRYNPGMQCGLVESLCLNSFPCLEKKEKNPAAVFHKCEEPCRCCGWPAWREWASGSLRPVEPAAGLAFQRHPPAAGAWPVPQGVTLGPGCKRSRKRWHRSLFLGPSDTSPLRLVCSFREPPGRTYLGISVGGAHARLAFPRETGGRREKAEPARRGVGDRPGRWGGRGKGGREGCGPHRPVSQPPCFPSPGCPTLQTGYPPPGVCPGICPHSVMHDLCTVKKPWWCAMTSDPSI